MISGWGVTNKIVKQQLCHVIAVIVDLNEGKDKPIKVDHTAGII
jgi:hypothetical protein